MFKKLFGKKESVKATEPEASKGYHSCVSTCEEDIENLETEICSQKSDNVKLIGEVASLKVANKELKEELEEEVAERVRFEGDLFTASERIAELEKRLEEADERADGTPVKYASARKTLTKAKLKALRERLDAVPDSANGFGGSVSVYDKKTKRVSVVEFKSKADALAVLEKAEKGNVDIIM